MIPSDRKETEEVAKAELASATSKELEKAIRAYYKEIGYDLDLEK